MDLRTFWKSFKEKLWKLNWRSRYDWVAAGVFITAAGLLLYFDSQATKPLGSEGSFVIQTLWLIGVLIILGCFLKPFKEAKPPTDHSNLNPAEPLRFEEAKLLWEWASKQDTVSIEEFATAIVGIGALFFAYGSVKFPHTGLLIALVGLAGSLILWLHLYASRKEYYTLKQHLRNAEFVKAFDLAQTWREKDTNRFLYHPISRLMTYFMGLVSWAWFTLILSRLNVATAEIQAVPSAVLLAFAIGLTLVRKFQDLKRKDKGSGLTAWQVKRPFN